MHFQMQCRILQSRGWNRNAIKSNIKSMGSHCNALPLPFADFILYWINCYLSDFWELHYQKYFLSVAYFNASQLTRSVGLVQNCFLSRIIPLHNLPKLTGLLPLLFWRSSFLQRKRCRAPVIITTTYLSKFLTIISSCLLEPSVPLKSEVLTNAIAMEFANEGSFPKNLM